jgi:hypothetical protein
MAFGHRSRAVRILRVVAFLAAVFGPMGVAEAGGSKKNPCAAVVSKVSNSPSLQAFRNSAVGQKFIQEAKKRNCPVVKALGW